MRPKTICKLKGINELFEKEINAQNNLKQRKITSKFKILQDYKTNKINYI